MVNSTKFGLRFLLAKYVKLTATWQRLRMVFQIGRIHRPMLLLEPYSSHPNQTGYPILILKMTTHLFHLMLLPLLVLNLRHLILLLLLMNLIPGHASLALEV
jgi:hypothetical protein